VSPQTHTTNKESTMNRHLGVLALSSVLFAAVGALTSCADEPTRPSQAPTSTAEARQSLDLSADDRRRLHAALLFARDQAMLGLERRDPADRVAAALVTLAERAEQDDRVGVERAMAVARSAVERYRDLAGSSDDAAAVDLEAITLTLDQAAELARESKAGRSDRTSSKTANSREERQP
jgi:hypothetical protein